MKFDIIIIGAGPAGLLAAWCLEGTGISYTVIEKGNVYLNVGGNVTNQSGAVGREQLVETDENKKLSAAQYRARHRHDQRQRDEIPLRLDCFFHARSLRLFRLNFIIASLPRSKVQLFQGLLLPAISSHDFQLLRWP